MEGTSHVGQRLQQFLDHYKLTARQAAVRMGDEKSGKIYKLLSGDAKPGFDTLTQMMAVWPELSADWLVMGRGAMLRNGAAASDAPAALPGKTPPRGVFSQQLVTVTIDKTGKDATLMVPLMAQAGYPTHFNDPVFLEDMRSYTIPSFERGSYRAFEVDGLSMYPTFAPSDVVVCSLVDRWDLLRPGQCYVVVTAENVLLKRINTPITDPTATVELLSDNLSYETYSVPVEDVMQLWMVRGFVSTTVPSRPDPKDDVLDRLREAVESLGNDYHEVRRFMDDTRGQTFMKAS